MSPPCPSALHISARFLLLQSFSIQLCLSTPSTAFLLDPSLLPIMTVLFAQSLHVPGRSLLCPSAQGHLYLHFSLEASLTAFPTLSRGYQGSVEGFLFLADVLTDVMALSPRISNLKQISTKFLCPSQELFPQNHHQVCWMLYSLLHFTVLTVPTGVHWSDVYLGLFPQFYFYCSLLYCPWGLVFVLIFLFGWMGKWEQAPGQGFLMLWGLRGATEICVFLALSPLLPPDNQHHLPEC